MSDAKVYAAVLAGGVGRRMGEGERPKQFLMLADRPILIHTLSQFVAEPSFRKVIVLCPEDWLSYTQELIREYLPEHEPRVVVTAGGKTRNETIMNAIDQIESEGNLDEDTIIVTHDSVRPFVTKRIIEKNIRCVREYGACVTATPATDTILISGDGESISEIPERRCMYRAQTPQTFPAMQLKRLYESLTDEEKEGLTDAAGIFVRRGERVHIVEGEERNIKITYPHDLFVTEALLNAKND